MFADTLLHAEQLHFLQLMLWGAANVVAGGGSVLVARRKSLLLFAFGAACLAMGGVELLAGWYRYHSAALRDYSAAVRLDRQLWFELGASVGALAVGVVTGTLSWRLAKRFELVGIGAAIGLHAVAIALMDVQLVSILNR